MCTLFRRLGPQTPTGLLMACSWSTRKARGGSSRCSGAADIRTGERSLAAALRTHSTPHVYFEKEEHQTAPQPLLQPVAQTLWAEKRSLPTEAVGSLSGILLLTEGGLSGWVLLWILLDHLPAAPAGRSRSPVAKCLSGLSGTCWLTRGRNLSQFQVPGLLYLQKWGLLLNFLYSEEHPQPCLAPQ